MLDALFQAQRDKIAGLEDDLQHMRIDETQWIRLKLELDGELAALRAANASLKHQMLELYKQVAPTVILSHLSAEDCRRFAICPFLYSASTGPGGNSDLGAYIATYLSELHRAVELFGWRSFFVEARGEQWIVRQWDSAASQDSARSARHRSTAARA